MALPCHINLVTCPAARALPHIGYFHLSSPLQDHHCHWKCSPHLSFLHLIHRPKTAGISVSPNVYVAPEPATSGYVAQEIRGLPISRRDVGVAALALVCMAASFLQHPHLAHSRQRRNTKAIPIEDYKSTSDGMKYYDLVEGNGPVATRGSTVLVHFDCVYRGLTVVSSRESKILAGNRVIAQPYEFTVGSSPGKERKREFVDNPNGLFSAQAAPKPPAALYTVTEGMRVGGQRTVIVPPEFGYGKKGMNEIPPNGIFELNIELLEVKSPTPTK